MLNYLQKLGKSLMVPVAVLPAAAILMGFGYWLDPTGWGSNSVVAALLINSGGALIDNMGILFAVGVAFGMSKDKNGAAALTGLVGWLVVQRLLDPASISLFTGNEVENVNAAFGSVNTQFIGILIGLISAAIYNKTYQVQLPPAFSFFAGRRLSAIVNAGISIILSIILMFTWPSIYDVLIQFGELLVGFGAVGAGLFGFFNRLLIPLGLHHALNSVFWFDVAGINDIPNYLSGTGEPGITGIYQAGFFPIMMFGLPAAALAIYQEALPENKKKVGGLLLGGAVAAFFTGVTEPLEFSFMFVAPQLYLLHAILTGISLFISAKMQWIAGFGFSAGFIDYFLSFKNPMAVNNIFLLGQGVMFGSIYYISFRVMIRKFNILTPGRKVEDDTSETGDQSNGKYDYKAEKILTLIGKENLKSIDYCTTRLRLEVNDSYIYKEEDFKNIGIMGIIRPSKTNIQLIIGADVQFVADALEVHYKKEYNDNPIIL